jgi:hypothetical protein
MLAPVAHRPMGGIGRSILSDIMTGITHNFVILVRELAGIDIEEMLRKHAPTDQDNSVRTDEIGKTK